MYYLMVTSPVHNLILMLVYEIEKQFTLGVVLNPDLLELEINIMGQIFNSVVKFEIFVI